MILNKADKEKIREEIEKRIATKKEELEKLHASCNDSHEKRTPGVGHFHLGESASETESNEIIMNIYQRQTKYLSSLCNALVRIDDVSFGMCEICNDPIPIERLFAVPGTTLCVPCKNSLNSQNQKH